MKTIKQTFEEINAKFIKHSSLINYVRTLKTFRLNGGTLTQNSITIWFNKLVDKGDYEIDSKDDILKFIKHSQTI